MPPILLVDITQGNDARIQWFKKDKEKKRLAYEMICEFDASTRSYKREIRGNVSSVPPRYQKTQSWARSLNQARSHAAALAASE